MDPDLAQKAVAAALVGNWNEAISFNKELLKENPEDNEALNRLAKAHFELGNIKKARSLSEKVLKNDPFNSIANRNLSKWRGIKSAKNSKNKPPQAIDFIEEPGKTKLVSLLCLGDRKALAELNAGDEVRITVHAHRVSIVTLSNKYIGRLPDDLAARLKRLIIQGNCYQVFIKSIEPKEIKVFIRETFRTKKLSQVPSFELVHKKEDFPMLTSKRE